jgi:hypothetical protein
LLQLIDRAAIGSTPIAPLRSVNPAKIPFFIGPLVPDRHAMLVEEANIRFAADKPKQLKYDGFKMHAFSREKRETPGEIKSDLGPKIGNGTNTGAIFFGFAFFEN